MARRVSTKTGASAPSKGFKTATGKGRGGATAGPGSRKPAQKPQVVAFNESTVDAINKSGPPGHEVAHINPREGRLLKALGGSGKKDPETNIKSYEVVGDKKGKNLPKVAKKYDLKGLPKKGEGRVDDTHRVILATDKETKALNALKNFDKARGYDGGSGPEITRLAEMDFTPLEHVRYRGEVIPNLNTLDTDSEGNIDSGPSNAGEKDESGNYNTSDNTGNFWDTPAGKKEAARIAREKAEREAKEKAEKEAKEKAEKEAKEKAEREAKAKREMKEAIAAAERKEARKDEKIEKEKEKALERKEKREQKAIEDAEALEVEEAEIMSTIEEEADEAAELDLEGENQDIGDYYDFDFESGDRIGGPVAGMDGYVWQEPSGYGGASATDAYEPVKEEDFTPTTDDIDNISYFDPDEPPEPDEPDTRTSSKSSGNPNQDAADEGDDGGDEINDTSSGEGDALGGDSGDDAGVGDTSTGGYDPSLDNETLGGDSHDNDPLDEPLGGDAGDGGISIDEPLDDALDEPLGGDAGDGGVSIDDTDDDLGNDSNPGGYDPDADDDILGPDNSADGGGSTIDETDDDPTNDLYPDWNQNDDNEDEPGVEDDTEPESTGDADKDKLLADLEEKYGEYGDTDYRKLYFDEFDDDRLEDYTAAQKGKDYNFLTSGDRSEFNTAGNTINDQLTSLEERFEGEELDALNEQAELYAEAPNEAIEAWYKKQKAAILDGTIDSLEPLDLSEWSDPSEFHDPEFFGERDETGDKVYDKRYYDPDKKYYTEGQSLFPDEEEEEPDSSLEGSEDLHGEVVDGEFVPDTLDDEGGGSEGLDEDDSLHGFDFGDEWPPGTPTDPEGITGPLPDLHWSDPTLGGGGADNAPDTLVPSTTSELTVDENGLPQGTTTAQEQPEILEEAPEPLSAHNSYVDPETGEVKTETRDEWSASIDEHIIDDPDNPVGDESSNYDGRYEGMTEDDIYNMVDLYNEENEYLPGDDEYRYGEDEIALEYGAEVKDPDDFSFQDQIDAYNIGMGLNPGDPDYMYNPETEDTGTDTTGTDLFSNGPGGGSGGGSDTGDTHIASTPGTTTKLTDATGIEHTYGGGGDNFHYAGGGSGSSTDFDFASGGGLPEAPKAVVKDTRVNNKKKPLSPWERNRGSGGGGDNFHYSGQ